MSIGAARSSERQDTESFLHSAAHASTAPLFTRTHPGTPVLTGRRSRATHPSTYDKSAHADFAQGASHPLPAVDTLSAPILAKGARDSGNSLVQPPELTNPTAIRKRPA